MPARRDPRIERRREFLHGALVILLDGPELADIASARAAHDPRSAEMIGPHVTVTPPFVAAPSPAMLERARRIVAARLPMALTIGPADRFPGTDVVYLRVQPPGPVRALRAELLATGHFAPDPFADDRFIPHVTISEFGDDPDGAERAAATIASVAIVCTALAWVAPAAGYRFVSRATLA